MSLFSIKQQSLRHSAIIILSWFILSLGAQRTMFRSFIRGRPIELPRGILVLQHGNYEAIWGDECVGITISGETIESRLRYRLEVASGGAIPADNDTETPLLELICETVLHSIRSRSFDCDVDFVINGAQRVVQDGSFFRMNHGEMVDWVCEDGKRLASLPRFDYCNCVR